MPDKKNDPFADNVGELVSAAQRGDLAEVRERARSLAYATDMAAPAAAPEEPAEAEEAPPREPSFHERFSHALDEKAAKEASS